MSNDIGITIPFTDHISFVSVNKSLTYLFLFILSYLRPKKFSLPEVDTSLHPQDFRLSRGLGLLPTVNEYTSTIVFDTSVYFRGVLPFPSFFYSLNSDLKSLIVTYFIWFIFVDYFVIIFFIPFISLITPCLCLETFLVSKPQSRHSCRISYLWTDN